MKTLEANAHNIDAELFRSFKTYCAKRGVTMRDGLAEAIRQYMARMVSGQERGLIAAIKKKKEK